MLQEATSMARPSVRSRRPGRSVRARRFGVALGLALLVAPAIAGTAHSAPDDQSRLNDLRRQAAAAADDLGVRDAQADDAQARVAEASGQVAKAEAALGDARHHLVDAQRELRTRKAELAAAQTAQRQAQERLDAAIATVNTARDQLRMMMRSALQSGVGGDLDALMQSGTPGDLAERMGILDHLSAARQQRIAALDAARAALAEEESRLDAARRRSADAVAAADAQVRQVADTVNDARQAEQRLVELQKSRTAALAAARSAADSARARYTALQKTSDDLAALLRRRAAEHPNGPARPVPGKPGKSGLIMPTTGMLTSPFGYRDDPLGRGRRFHAGQDFGAPVGTPILAATAGTVAYAGWASGYGNYTCIDRGAGFATCYGHQSKILVSVGQGVQQGQQIGLVGNTGNSTGPHLHFEVRLNGDPVDPMPYLP
jgi:murein DD-endopeptidase MepM/ murein hydrolase activator NlpD